MLNACRQISEMNASVAVVIVSEETNISLSWTRDFPPVLLADEIAVSDDQTQDKCNHVGRVAIKGTWQRRRRRKLEPFDIRSVRVTAMVNRIAFRCTTHFAVAYDQSNLGTVQVRINDCGL